jgi:hypothetical protein
LVPVPKTNWKDAGTAGVAPKLEVKSALKAAIVFSTIAKVLVAADTALGTKICVIL